jgi:hypothetical protein
MFDRQDIRAAEDAGILTRDQATRLEAFLAKRADPQIPVSSDTESLRFLNNFNDIFITIGIVILTVGLTAVLGLMFGATMLGLPIVICVAAITWLMAEYFCRRRRMLLPSMALIAIFTLNAGLAIGIFATGAVRGFSSTDAEALIGLGGALDKLDNAGVAGFFGCFAASVLAWWRFRLPFALFLAAIAAAATIYAAAGFWADAQWVLGGLGALLVGAATLMVALWFDAQDPGRITRKTDYAFWLHMAAAPQIIMGLRGLVTGGPFDMPDGVQSFILLACLIALGIFSLAINRRALILSGLLAFWAALNDIVDQSGNGNTFIASALILGTGIVLLGGGWHTARRWLLKLLPASRLFPPERAA